MKKLFLTFALAFICCSSNAQTDGYQVITVIHNPTEQICVQDTLRGRKKRFTTDKVVLYARSKIPHKYLSENDSYTIINNYSDGSSQRFLLYTIEEQKYLYSNMFGPVYRTSKQWKYREKF